MVGLQDRRVDLLPLVRLEAQPAQLVGVVQRIVDPNPGPSLA